jgi:hypothetical protein
MMPALTSRHAAFRTGGQIGITDFVEAGDDLSLGGVGIFHFTLCAHGAYFCGADR